MEYSADYKSALAVVVPACCCGFVIHNNAFGNSQQCVI